MSVKKVSDIAKGWLDCNAVIIDTETTGLDAMAQLVEVSAIDCTGKVLMDTLVSPVCPINPERPNDRAGLSIPFDATAIHGISDEMIHGKPFWDEIHETFEDMVRDRTVIIYNAEYDTRILRQTAASVLLGYPLSGAGDIGCAMLAYANYRGEWNHRKRGYRWHKLTDAAEHEGVDTSEITAHRALGDCMMTLGVIKAMAEVRR